jgi:hypothetical protein
LFRNQSPFYALLELTKANQFVPPRPDFRIASGLAGEARPDLLFDVQMKANFFSGFQ